MRTKKKTPDPKLDLAPGLALMLADPDDMCQLPLDSLLVPAAKIDEILGRTGIGYPAMEVAAAYLMLTTAPEELYRIGTSPEAIVRITKFMDDAGGREAAKLASAGA